MSFAIKEMQIKAITRYHLTLTEVAMVKRERLQALVRMWRNWNSDILLEGMSNDTATVTNSLAVLQKIKHRVNPSRSLP